MLGRVYEIDLVLVQPQELEVGFEQGSAAATEPVVVAAFVAVVAHRTEFVAVLDTVVDTLAKSVAETADQFVADKGSTVDIVVDRDHTPDTVDSTADIAVAADAVAQGLEKLLERVELGQWSLLDQGFEQ